MIITALIVIGIATFMTLSKIGSMFPGLLEKPPLNHRLIQFGMLMAALLTGVCGVIWVVGR